MAPRFLSEYGMFVVLLVLCAGLSIATLDEQQPTGAAGGEGLAEEVVANTPPGARVLIIVRSGPEDAAFAKALSASLQASGRTVVATVSGGPADVRQALESASSGGGLDAVAATKETGGWGVLEDVGARFPALRGTRVFVPASYYWPSFLKADNLRNVADQIAVIAIMAIGMTLVIVTAGIDLSVGSLLALSAVIATRLIRDYAGAEDASATAMVVCCAVAIACCGSVGALTGTLVTWGSLPPFIVTLGMMLVARGLAFKIADGQSIFEVPESFVGLGRGTLLGRIPNAVYVMLALYVVAHLVMTRTTLGRYVYAVGGNPEAARLSGVSIPRVHLTVYVVSGLLAGLGGVVTASQLKSGSPVYGQMYELYVIAAVVVGGTSLSGGEGTIFGTLVGAFLIAVIHNGMNLLQLSSFDQMIVLGGVIITAVLLDRLKRRGAGARDWLTALRLVAAIGRLGGLR